MLKKQLFSYSFPYSEFYSVHHCAFFFFPQLNPLCGVFNVSLSSVFPVNWWLNLRVVSLNPHGSPTKIALVLILQMRK